jgi:hypothetical protein
MQKLIAKAPSSFPSETSLNDKRRFLSLEDKSISLGFSFGKKGSI